MANTGSILQKLIDKRESLITRMGRTKDEGVKAEIQDLITDIDTRIDELDNGSTDKSGGDVSDERRAEADTEKRGKNGRFEK